MHAFYAEISPIISFFAPATDNIMHFLKYVDYNGSREGLNLLNRDDTDSQTIRQMSGVENIHKRKYEQLGWTRSLSCW